MDLFQSIILGIVEGLTEFLPISSTGHLILATDLLKIPQTEFVKTFQIAIQSGAILAIVFVYWKKLINDYLLIKKIVVAFIPTALVGFFLYGFIKNYLIGNPQIVVAMLFVGGIALIIIELFFKKRTEKREDNKVYVSYEKAFAIGVFQAISVVPGVSRAAATIIGGMIVGLPRKNAVEFSFFLAIPTIIAATALDIRESNFTFNINEWTVLLAGTIVSFVVALLTIKWLIKYVQTSTFIPFGIYRIILSVLYFLLILS